MVVVDGETGSVLRIDAGGVVTELGQVEPGVVDASLTVPTST